MARHAVLVGVSRFEDAALGVLKAPQDDVRALAAVLADASRGGFTVTTSLDEPYDTIRAAVWKMLRDCQPEDTALIYYSGHGISPDIGKLYLATEKTMADDPRMYSLSASDIREMMGESRASRLVVILDCCHSGAFGDGAKGAAAPVGPQTFADADSAEGEYVLMSCNAMQVSLDGEAAGLSRFTSWLVDGIGKGAAAPSRPEITLDNLYDYLVRRAREAGAAMTPQRVVRRNSGTLVISENPAMTAPELPADVVTKLSDADYKTRLAAAGTLRQLAEDPVLRPAVRAAAVARLAVERDTDVSATLADLVSGRPPPEDTITQVRTEETTAVPSARDFNKWEMEILRRAGLEGAGLSSAADEVLRQRAAALRATWRWFFWAIAFLVVLPCAGWSITQNQYDPNYETGVWTMTCAVFAAGVLGLTRKQLLGAMPDEAATRIAAAAPMIQFLWYRLDAKLAKRTAWLALVGGVLGMLGAGAATASLGGG